jgi:hypothetical protein
MGRALGSIAVVLALTLALISSPPALALMLSDVYYLDATQGMYYAVNTNGTSYRVFYIDSSGNTVFITAYWWDASSSYIIFQSPISGRVYIRKESYTLTTLDTRSWYSLSQSDFQVPPDPSTLSGTANFEFFSGTATWAIGSSTWTTVAITKTFNSYTITSVSYSPATGVTAYATGTWTVSQDKRATIQWTTWVSLTYDTTPSFRVKFNSPATSIVSLSFWTKWDTYTYNNALSYYVSGATYPYRRTTYSAAPSLTDQTNGVISVSNVGASTVSASTAPTTMVSNITAVVRYSYSTSTTGSKVFPKDSSNTITASNGNKIKVFDSVTQLVYAQLYATSSTYSYYLYTQQITVSFPATRDVSKPLIVVLDTTSISTTVKSPNPAVFISDISAWVPAYLINYGTSETYLVVPLPYLANRNSLTLSLVYNYPVQYTAPQLSFRYTTDVVSVLAVSGTVTVQGGVTTISGTIALGNYVGSTLILSLTGSNSYTVSKAVYTQLGSSRLLIYVNSTDATISANPINIVSVLILYNTVTEVGYSFAVSSVSLQQWTMDKISYIVAGNIVGSWSYRIPIYITLAELPQSLAESGFVFRIELPVGDWVKAGLLSPGLEDLMIVDAASKPCVFYIYRLRDDGRAVIYVRYDAPLTSTTLVLYVLLQNKPLWGTGRTFSSLAVFDRTNPRDFADDFGYSVFYSYLSYNAVLVAATDATRIKLGKTWYDFVAVNRTHLVEQHGSTVFYNTTLPSTFGNDDELLVYIGRDSYDSVLIYRNGQPLVGFRLSEYQASPAYYIGYRDARAVYVFRMLMYTYAVGQLTGGYQRPPEVVKTPATPVATQPVQVDWFSLFMMIFAVLALSIAVKWISEGGGGGSGGRPIRLP